jgi:hypothetical protein
MDSGLFCGLKIRLATFVIGLKTRTLRVVSLALSDQTAGMERTKLFLADEKIVLWHDSLNLRERMCIYSTDEVCGYLHKVLWKLQIRLDVSGWKIEGPLLVGIEQQFNPLN